MLRRLFASCVVILIALALPLSALAQDYYFGVEQETVHVYWNENGTLSLDYTFVFDRFNRVDYYIQKHLLQLNRIDVHARNIKIQGLFQANVFLFHSM